jgi:hypothetical protein
MHGQDCYDPATEKLDNLPTVGEECSTKSLQEDQVGRPSQQIPEGTRKPLQKIKSRFGSKIIHFFKHQTIIDLHEEMAALERERKLKMVRLKMLEWTRPGWPGLRNGL